MPLLYKESDKYRKIPVISSPAHLIGNKYIHPDISPLQLLLQNPLLLQQQNYKTLPKNNSITIMCIVILKFFQMSEEIFSIFSVYVDFTVKK